MNTKKILGIVLLVAVIGLIVWKFAVPAKPDADLPEDTNTLPTTSITGAALNDKGDFAYKSETDFVNIEAEYPSKTSLAGAADAKARLTMEQWAGKRMGDFLTMVSNELLTPDEQVRLKEMGRKYAMGISYETHASPGYVSYVYEVYEDTGGAHPNIYYTTFTFDMNGDKKELADLFTKGSRYLDRLSAESYKRVVEESKKRFETDSIDGAQLDWIRMGTAPTPEALQFFYLNGSDLVLVFPPYQVSAYAAGTFEIPIPLATLGDILLK